MKMDLSNQEDLKQRIPLFLVVWAV